MSERASKRIAFVTDEILGVTKNAGGATANTFLALALANLGHRVEIHFAAPLPHGVASPWREEYARSGITVVGVPPFPMPVSPKTFAVAWAVERTLQPDPPDVVIGDDRYGSCYACLRSRSLGLGFENTLFVVYCHGTTAWIADAHRKLQRPPESFEVEALERAAVELADVAVSPSSYMVEWMRARGWRVPRAVVAPLLTAELSSGHLRGNAGGRIRTLAFFGRLEDRKGIGTFVDVVNRLDPRRLQDVELLFLGKETSSWDRGRVGAGLPAGVRSRFETDLDQPQALELLGRPGTIAVMPSLVDNSPMAIYECLTHGIPFVASSIGGGPELVVPEDRDRSFIEPTVDRFTQKLDALLSGAEETTAARPAFDEGRTRALWQSVVSESPPRRPDTHAVAESDDFVLVLAEGDEPDRDCLETLQRAQAASGADAVTCGVHRPAPETGLQVFLGNARELGVMANHYGIAGLYRRSLVEQLPHAAAGDAHWLWLASLALRGGKVVSVPRGLVRTTRTAGSAATDPVAPEVVRKFERAAPAGVYGAPTLAAGLAARSTRDGVTPSLGRRIRWTLANEGVGGVVRRATRCFQATTRAMLGQATRRR